MLCIRTQSTHLAPNSARGSGAPREFGGHGLEALAQLLDALACRPGGEGLRLRPAAPKVPFGAVEVTGRVEAAQEGFGEPRRHGWRGRAGQEVVDALWH